MPFPTEGYEFSSFFSPSWLYKKLDSMVGEATEMSPTQPPRLAAKMRAAKANKTCCSHHLSAFCQDAFCENVQLPIHLYELLVAWISSWFVSVIFFSYPLKLNLEKKETNVKNKSPTFFLW